MPRVLLGGTHKDMSFAAAFARVRHSPALKVGIGNIVYGFYLQPLSGIIERIHGGDYASAVGMALPIALQTVASAIVLGLNIAGDSSRRREFLTMGVANIVMAGMTLYHGVSNLLAAGPSWETAGVIGIGGAYLGWAATQLLKFRLDMKRKETEEKVWLRPAVPCAFADVAAVAGHPALIAFNGAVVAREFNLPGRLLGKRFDYAPVAEDAPVTSWGGMIRKHATGMRLLGLGLGAAGIAGMAGGLGAAYGAAYLIWMAGYFGFEPKRNPALRADFRSLRAA